MRSSTSIAVIAILAGPIAAAPLASTYNAPSTFNSNVARTVTEEVTPPPEEPAPSSFSENPIVQSAVGGAAGSIVANLMDKLEKLFRRDL